VTVLEKEIALTVVGPDDPLALGIVDDFQKHGLRIFGPKRAAATIESSKAFAKRLMRDADIRTASFKIFNSYNQARAYIDRHGTPVVIKASGLALGKGVEVCRTPDEAEKALQAFMIDRVCGSAGDQVVVEEYLDGEEISIHALCDGKTSVLFPPSQDHKQIREGEDMTGGMGTLAPVPGVGRNMSWHIDTYIVQPALKELARRRRRFTGLLYPGLKLTARGPKVLEFNARFGDPETQSYMRLLKTDMFDVLEACVNGQLSQISIEWNAGHAVCVVLASGGYPGEYKTGFQFMESTKQSVFPA